MSDQPPREAAWQKDPEYVPIPYVACIAQRLSSTAKVALARANAYQGTGRDCYLAMPRLAHEIGRSEKVARHCVKELIAGGWLEETEAPPGKPKRYRVHQTPLPRRGGLPSRRREAPPLPKSSLDPSHKREAKVESRIDPEKRIQKRKGSSFPKNPQSTDDRTTPLAGSQGDHPNANTGFPERWEPTPAEVAKLAALMATHTGKNDQPFAANILQLAAGGSQAAKSYSQIVDCVRDAAAHAKEPIRSNGFFETAVQRQFAPEAPRIDNRDIRAAAQALSMTRRDGVEADQQARIERNRQRAAERLAKPPLTSNPAYQQWQRDYELQQAHQEPK